MGIAIFFIYLGVGSIIAHIEFGEIPGITLQYEKACSTTQAISTEKGKFTYVTLEKETETIKGFDPDYFIQAFV